MGEVKMSNGSSWGKKVLAEERAKRNNTCEDCTIVGSDDLILEFHHIAETDINGIGRGLNRRASDIRKYPDRYKLLCPDCHKKAHRNETTDHN